MPARHHAFNTPHPLTLRIRNPAGDIDITAVETGETTVQIVARSGSGRDHADLTRVELSADGSQLDIEAPQRRYGSAARLTMILTLPIGSTVAATTASADLTCRGSLAGLEASTASGDVAADQVDGDVTVTSASGDVNLGAVTGSIECKMASGDLRVLNVEGGCRTTSASGDVRIGGCAGDLVARTASGDVQLRQAQQGSVDITTMSGDVKVGVRRGTVVWLDISTLSGRTRSDLDHQDAAPADDGEVLSISVRTMSGDVTLTPSTTSVG